MEDAANDAQPEATIRQLLSELEPVIGGEVHAQKAVAVLAKAVRTLLIRELERETNADYMSG